MRVGRRRDRRMLERALCGATVVAVLSEREASAMADVFEPFAPTVGLVALDGRYLLVDFSTASKRLKREVSAHFQRWKDARDAA